MYEHDTLYPAIHSVSLFSHGFFTHLARSVSDVIKSRGATPAVVKMADPVRRPILSRGQKMVAMALEKVSFHLKDAITKSTEPIGGLSPYLLATSVGFKPTIQITR